MLEKRKVGWAGCLALAAAGVAFGATYANVLIRDSTIVRTAIDASPIGASSPSTVVGTTVTGQQLVQGDVVNAGNSGFAQNGTAPAGHSLCGNGAHYVDSAAPCSIVIPQGSISFPSRSGGTTYTNGTGAVLEVAGALRTIGSNTGTVICYVNGTAAFANSSTATIDNGKAGFHVTVPAGASYACTGDGAVTQTVVYWSEVPIK